jgi:pyridoxine/pyridoxamine 5'-phosphate oxidase
MIDAVRFSPCSGEPARPERWGGYLVWAHSVELWADDPFRLHDRAVWTRELGDKASAGEDGVEVFPAPGPWTVSRIQP